MTATLGAWLHDLSPFALRISGSFTLAEVHAWVIVCMPEVAQLFM